MGGLIVIPARMASTRLPGKPLLPLGDHPMVIQVYFRAAESGLDAEIVVATDDDRIRRVCERYDVRVEMTLSCYPTGTDRVAEVARRIPSDWVINLQGDEPLIPTNLTEDIAQSIEDGNSFSSAMASIDSLEVMTDASVVKVVVDDNGNAMIFSRLPVPQQYTAADLEIARTEKVVGRHIGIYGYRRESLLRFTESPPSTLERIARLDQLRILQAGYRIKMVWASDYIGSVDTRRDYEAMCRHFPQPSVKVTEAT